jgi:hypothetical protein
VVGIKGATLAKTVFRIHAVYSDGATVIRKRLRRAEVLSFLAGLEPCLIGMEACATSHYWARELAKFGQTGAPDARQPRIGRDGNRRVRAAMVEFAWLGCRWPSAPRVRLPEKPQMR